MLWSPSSGEGLGVIAILAELAQNAMNLQTFANISLTNPYDNNKEYVVLSKHTHIYIYR